MIILPLGETNTAFQTATDRYGDAFRLETLATNGYAARFEAIELCSVGVRSDRKDQSDPQSINQIGDIGYTRIAQLKLFREQSIALQSKMRSRGWFDIQGHFYEIGSARCALAATAAPFGDPCNRQSDRPLRLSTSKIVRLPFPPARRTSPSIFCYILSTWSCALALFNLEYDLRNSL